MSPSESVVVVGAGLAGLAAAVELSSAEFPSLFWNSTAGGVAGHTRSPIAQRATRSTTANML